jgi:hypothetical protein
MPTAEMDGKANAGNDNISGQKVDAENATPEQFQERCETSFPSGIALKQEDRTSRRQ